MMEIVIRHIKLEEENEVRSLGRKAFGGFESLFIPKSKKALVALADGKIVAGVMIKILKGSAENKIGYIDYAFVDKAYHNHGIGSKIYKASIEYLWNEGCRFITAIVKDDNVASFGLLQKNGFERISLYEAYRQLGTKGFIRFWMNTSAGFGYGMDFYLASSDKKNPPIPKKDKTIASIGTYLLINMILLLLLILLYKSNDIIGLCGAYFTLLASGVVSGYITTLFSKREWEFRFLNCGAFISIIVMLLGNLLPMNGNWYPKKYENTKEFRKDAGLNVFVSWSVLLVLVCGANLLSQKSFYYQYLSGIGTIFLIYRIVAIYPLSSFGGERLFVWNKVLYGILAILSLVVLFI